MMDATNDDQDVLLHRSCPDLIADLQKSLDPFLWRTTTSGRKQARRNVRSKEATRLVNLLEPFQELPQLLDPYLDQFIPLLANAFLASLSQRRRTIAIAEGSTELLIPLRLAICRLLYTFCKVRGEKVIVRFFGTEVRYIEVLLSSIEDSSLETSEGVGERGWEERYITLLWLSQLLLAPFDLATISSGDIGEKAEVEELRWPEHTPSITIRVVRLVIKYLSSSGKERDAAKVLLVRVSLRRDMQDLGIFDALIKWALSALSRPMHEQGSNYFQIGLLSYLAGILSASVGTTYVQPYLGIINDKIQNITAENATFQALYSLAVARKTIIKVMRTLSILALQEPNSFVTSEIVEGTISSLLEALGDASTPVRFAASKALSMITLKLDGEMATQVIQAVLDSLQINVTWSTTSHTSIRVRDLSRVNPYEWHGLILTLSHLLYRRSPPLTSLSEILPALEMGLSFEQKSTTGASIGTNVRDAACFGIWALARRYTTSELNAISLSSQTHGNTASTLQHVANLLVVSACLDPAGNIRRGSSAALQELIGRHPDTIIEGIAVVQVVDYHAVALRSRSLQDVAVNVAKLGMCYHDILLKNLLGWRGVLDSSARTRENAARTFGLLSWLRFSDGLKVDWLGLNEVITMLCTRLSTLATRDVDARHGLILCLVHVLLNASNAVVDFDITWTTSTATLLSTTVSETTSQFSRFRTPELIAAATSQLVSATIPLLRRIDLDASCIQSITAFRAAINVFMGINNEESIEDITDAATELLNLIPSEQQQAWCNDWIVRAAKSGTSANNLGRTYISCIFRCMSTFSIRSELAMSVKAMIHNRWHSGQHVIHTKTAILSCLAKPETASQYRLEFLDLVTHGLDDYTTDARGDVGSFVRIEALRVVATLFALDDETADLGRVDFFAIVGQVLRLAAEKLDKVRAEAQMTLGRILQESAVSPPFTILSTSSVDYFSFLLNSTSMPLTESLNSHISIAPMDKAPHLLQSLLAGYVTSADTGSEDLVLSSRLALAQFCTAHATNSAAVFSALSMIVKLKEGEDRIVVPALEVLGFLNDVNCWRGIEREELRLLFLRTQKAQFKTSNVKKLDAAIKIYGALIDIFSHSTADNNESELRVKFVEKLTSMLSHPFPRVRERVVEELWCRCGLGKGIDVSVKAMGKDEVGRFKDDILVRL